MNDMNELRNLVPGSGQDAHYQAAGKDAGKKLHRRRIRDSGLAKNETHLPETTRRWRDKYKG